MDVQLPDGTVLRGVPDGTSKADLVAKLKSNGYDTSKLEPAVAVGQSVNAATNSIPRQVGLFARNTMEGLGEASQLLTEPIRYVTDRLTGSVGKTKPMGAVASDVADYIGLPKPGNSVERVAADASKLLAGSMGTMGVGTLAKGGQAISLVPEIAKDLPLGLGNFVQAVKSAPSAIGEFLAQAPVSQAATAAGAGLLGGSSREAGGSPLQQAAASLVGGLAGAGAVGVGNALANKAAALKNALMTPQQMDVKLSTVLQQSGVDYSQVPERVRQSLRAELGDALRANQELNPAAVSRLLDFQRNGLTPTRGMVSLDPVQITREQNLAKMAANSADTELHGLPRIQNQNNAQLITRMNELGAANGDALRAGERVTSSVLGTQAGLRGAEQSAWDAARGSAGYRQPISAGVLSDINGALHDEGLMPFMNPTISRYMEAFQTGQPFTPQAYRNLQSMLANEVAKGGNEGAAAGLARRILQNAELRPAGFQAGGNAVATPAMAGAMRGADAAATEAIDAVNAARGATRAAYAFEESTPLVRSVLSGGASSDPQRIAQRFVIGGTANEAADVAQQVGPNGIPVIKEAILAHLKEKALSGSSDEVGKFSQSAFNKALNQLGDRKLSMFFSPDEIMQLRSMGRAASYMQAQPVGSAVNNSNSGALLLGRGMDLLGQVPFAGPLMVPALKNIQISMGNRAAQNVIPGLLVQQPSTPLLSRFASPAIAGGGLLAAPGLN